MLSLAGDSTPGWHQEKHEMSSSDWQGFKSQGSKTDDTHSFLHYTLYAFKSNVCSTPFSARWDKYSHSLFFPSSLFPPLLFYLFLIHLTPGHEPCQKSFNTSCQVYLHCHTQNGATATRQHCRSRAEAKEAAAGCSGKRDPPMSSFLVSQSGLCELTCKALFVSLMDSTNAFWSGLLPPALQRSNFAANFVLNSVSLWSKNRVPIE